MNPTTKLVIDMVACVEPRYSRKDQVSYNFVIACRRATSTRRILTFLVAIRQIIIVQV